MKNLKLSSKFIIAFSLIIGISIISSFWIVTRINSIVENAEEVIDGNKLRAEINQKYIDHLKWSVKLGEHILDPLKDELDIEKDAHNCAFGKWYYGEERTKAEELVPQLKETFEKIETPHIKMHETAEKIETIAHNNSLDSAEKVIEIQKVYKTETIIHLNEVGIDLMNIVSESQEHIMTNDVMLSKAETTNFMSILISLIAAIFSIFLAVYLVKDIFNILGAEPSEIALILERVSGGDLTITYNSNKKVGVYKNVENMTEKLKEIVHSVVYGAENISSASEQMSSNTQSLSQGANNQASSIEEVSSSMEEMSSNIQQNTDNAQQTEKISQQAASEIQESSVAVNQTVDAMKQIAGKISIITDIAFQTNILALNAAVEAARAGEHGRGFAVVAAEVRKLAERSQVAASEIVQITGSSVEIAEKSGRLLAGVVPNIQNTSKLVQEITAASMEMSSGSNQVNKAIQQLNQITQENAAAAEEMATTAEELSGQAQQN